MLFLTGAFSIAAVHSRRMESLLDRALRGRKGKRGRAGPCREELCCSSMADSFVSLLSELDSAVEAILKPE